MELIPHLQNQNKLLSSGVHNICLNLKVIAPSTEPIDQRIRIIVLIDISSSMATNEKMDYMKATLEYLHYRLNEHHQLALITFNQDIHFELPLLPMTTQNKQFFYQLIQKLKANGSTNISDALSLGLKIIEHANKEELIPSTILLFTDGIPNTGFQGEDFYKFLENYRIPNNLTINTLGFGNDHDSSLLREIALSSGGGVYYYLAQSQSIGKTFGQILGSIFNTVATNCRLRILCRDGCRLTEILTHKGQASWIENHKTVKDYSIYLGNLYRGETTNLVFKLSIRKLEQPQIHHLMDFDLEYQMGNQRKNIWNDFKIYRGLKPIDRGLMKLLWVFKYGFLEGNYYQKIPKDIYRVISKYLDNEQNILDNLARIRVAKFLIYTLENVIGSEIVGNLIPDLDTYGDSLFMDQLKNDLLEVFKLEDTTKMKHSINGLLTMYLTERSTSYLPDLEIDDRYTKWYQAVEMEHSEVEIERYKVGL